MSFEITFYFTPSLNDHLSENEILEIRKEIVSSFMNAGFGGIIEEPDGEYVNAFAVPVSSGFSDYVRENEQGEIRNVVRMIKIYRFNLPMFHGDIGGFINNELPRITNVMKGLSPNISFQFSLDYY